MSGKDGADPAARDRQEAFFVGWSERFSRKGFVVRLGQILLRVIGVSFIPLLPVDHIVPNAEACGISCSTYWLCGLYGRQCCANCWTGTGTNTCPTCASRGTSFWSSCCPGAPGLPGQNCVTVRYYDCCSSDINCDCSLCLFCANNSRQLAWCNSGSYVCSVAMVGGPCSCL
jgi:hypothetical protein